MNAVFQRRGQAPGQVLVYAMSIILVSLIMVFGYKAIGMFIGQSDQVAKIRFASDLDSTLNKMDYGDVELRSFTIPKEYKMICFTSNYEGEPELEDRSKAGLNPLIISQWMNTDNNIFLLSGIDSFYAFKVRKLHVDTDANGADDDQDDTARGTLTSHRCIETNGKFTIRMQSMGPYIFISSNISESGDW